MPFQLAEMKEKEWIFMFTANIALKTKKRLKTQKGNKAFQESQDGTGPKANKSVELAGRKK